MGALSRRLDALELQCPDRMCSTTFLRICAASFLSTP